MTKRLTSIIDIVLRAFDSSLNFDRISLILFSKYNPEITPADSTSSSTINCKYKLDGSFQIPKKTEIINTVQGRIKHRTPDA